MINVKEFLLENKIETGVYALVSYDGIVEPIWFSKYKQESGKDWFLESPCELYKLIEIDKPTDDFALEYADSILEEGVDREKYIEENIKPMIVDFVLYEIENFQCSPYLPKMVDDIKIITERECLEFMLNPK